MRVEALGDAAFVVRELGFRASAVAEALLNAGVPEILDASAAYDTVGVYTRPGGLEADRLQTILAQLNIQETGPGRLHDVPVCYEMGEDLAAASQHLELAPEAIIDLHTSLVYECFAVGFCPGFPYLGWLAEGLKGVPRRPSPRTRVEPGSVGITGRQTGVYPLPTPGGWSLIGRTPLTLVDVKDRYFPIQAGDRVQFRAIDLAEFERIKGERL